MAAEVIRAAGHRVAVYDAKPSACRKVLLAGTSGLNISHAEPFAEFIQRYYDKADWLAPALHEFNADALREWCQGLGISTFVGSSGRVFTEQMKAAPLVRHWLKRLRESGVEFHMRHKLMDMADRTLRFEHQGETVDVQADAVVLALGGGSWPQLGSDGSWQRWLEEAGVKVLPLRSANCGFDCTWSEHLKERFAGQPLKNVVMSVQTGDGYKLERRGECVITQSGLEGSLVYALSKALREQIDQKGHAELSLDLLPDLSLAQLTDRLGSKRAKESFGKYLKRTAGLGGVKAALVYECLERPQTLSQEKLAKHLKALPIRLERTRPIEEAISSAGGVCQSALDQNLMLTQLPGFFCAGEMLDWEAPTGGYLLTACFATGRLAGRGVCTHLHGQGPSL
ncbi:TIGR03862 family flavoprotein [Bowmanella dokdonensis]|uniref:TIGR03862 family flavoprotein n=2 Tax=Bowmanella dokdonensis TaxID=751969 RepID=A0A939DMZ6_9ALTE|nr:TIGR03862 family flavoprotein [Bowmanella dokdonensis]